MSVKTLVFSATRLTQTANDERSSRSPAMTSTIQTAVARPRLWRRGASAAAGASVCVLICATAAYCAAERERRVQRAHGPLDVCARESGT